MTTLQTEYKHIVRTPGFYGAKPCIENHKIAVHDIAIWTQQGRSPGEIAHSFHLTLSQVYSALSYYYDHKDEIDRENLQEAAEIKARAQADTSPLAQRLRTAFHSHIYASDD